MAFASLLADRRYRHPPFCTVRGVCAMQLRHRRLGLFWVRLGPFGVYGSSLLCPEKRTSRDAVTSPFCAKRRLMHRSKQHLDSITSSAMESSPGGTSMPSARAA
jgi:hypothetical protein